MAGIFGSPMGSMIGSVIGGVVSGAMNAAGNAAKNYSGSTASSSSGSSTPSSGSSGNSGSSSGASQSLGNSGSAAQTSGGRVLESVNGKAPSNAQIGDTIVTNGGSWKITGKNPDGSWISQKVSDVSKGNAAASTGSAATNNFAGSATGVVANDDYQAQIIAQMNANSKAWYQATTQAEKDALHAKNEQLSALLGGNVSYDGSTGTWSGTGDPGMPKAEKADVGNLQDTLDRWLAAAQQQSQNSNDYAVSQGINELTRAENDAQAQFQTQRDQIAAQEALNKDNQALYAEARGDRGGIGEAQYDSIMNTAMQERAAVNQAQTKLSTDTARQIADLRAQGEFQKADDLLQLTQNYLSQLISLQEWALSYNFSVDQFNASLQQWRKEFDLSVGQLLGTYNGMPTLDAQQIAYNQQQDLQQQLASAGSTLLGSGIMPSDSQLSAMGMTKEQAQSFIKAWQIASTASSGGGGSNVWSGVSDYESVYQKMYSIGIRQEKDAKEYLTANGYTNEEAKYLAEKFVEREVPYYDALKLVDSKRVRQYHELVINNKDGYDVGDPENIAAMIKQYNDQGLLTGDEIRALFMSFGLDPSNYGN